MKKATLMGGPGSIEKKIVVPWKLVKAVDELIAEEFLEGS